MINVVRPSISLSNASRIRRSDSASSADVASSRMMTRGLVSTARAIASRCRCPPDSCTPSSPSTVS